MFSLSWLHLSDFHVGRDPAQLGSDPSLPALLDDLVEDVRCQVLEQKLQPDFLFLTGDLVQAGKASQYQQADVLVERLRSAAAASGGQPQVFLVPGNHDVDRARIRPETRRLHARIRKDYQTAGDKLGQILISPEKEHPRELLFEKLGPYAEYVGTHHKKSKIRAREPWYCQPVELGAGRPPVFLIGLNTALLCQEGDRPSSLALARRQIDRALEDRDQRGEGMFTIVLMHHPAHWMADFLEIQSLLDRRVDVVLSGHEHRSRPAFSRGRLLFEYAAGSADDTRSHWGNAWSAVRLELRDSSLPRRALDGSRIVGRSWWPREERWGPDLHLDSTGEFHLAPLRNFPVLAAAAESMAHETDHLPVDDPERQVACLESGLQPCLGPPSRHVEATKFVGCESCRSPFDRRVWSVELHARDHRFYLVCPRPCRRTGRPLALTHRDGRLRAYAGPAVTSPEGFPKPLECSGNAFGPPEGWPPTFRRKVDGDGSHGAFVLVAQGMDGLGFLRAVTGFIHLHGGDIERMSHSLMDGLCTLVLSGNLPSDSKQGDLQELLSQEGWTATWYPRGVPASSERREQFVLKVCSLDRRGLLYHVASLVVACGGNILKMEIEVLEDSSTSRMVFLWILLEFADEEAGPQGLTDELYRSFGRSGLGYHFCSARREEVPAV